jgi:hypothetical protein
MSGTAYRASVAVVGQFFMRIALTCTCILAAVLAAALPAVAVNVTVNAG